jgi:hypothetical protein
MDDGRKHCMASRKVGAGPDGCIYSLVGEIDRATYEDLVDGATQPEDVFVDARDLCLVVVYEATDAVSNVSSVRDFADVSEVPAEYLPPSPVISFGDIPDGAE